MAEDYLKPKTKTPPMIRDKENGQFVNPPPYMDQWGGFTSGEKLSGAGKHLQLEKKPQAKRGPL